MSVLRKNGKDAQLLLYRLSYPVKRRGNFAYSGQSWFIGAKKGFYFKGRGTCFIADTSIRFEECSCDACKGKVAYQLVDDVKTLALHNLLQTVGRFG